MYTLKHNIFFNNLQTLYENIFYMYMHINFVEWRILFCYLFGSSCTWPMEEPHLGLMPQKALQIQYFKMHVALNHSENKM